MIAMGRLTKVLFTLLSFGHRAEALADRDPCLALLAFNALMYG
jgi:hypothetical protein